MSERMDRHWLTIFTLILSGLVGSPTFADDEPAEVAFSACTIGDGRARVTAECAEIDVPLDHEIPDADTITLAVARIPARRDSAGNDAFTLIAGGPGQSALDSWPGVALAFRHIARDRDVILVDQRGTGRSVRLDCAEEVEARACLASLASDPTLFTTSVAVRDLEFVRQELGVTRWNLYGVSYGTRVAQHYARRYPASVRTMILDAAVPADVPLGPDVAPFAQRALDLILERCAADTDCATAFPDLPTRVANWSEALVATPVDVAYEDLSNGEQRDARFDHDQLAAVLRLMSYSAQTASLLPSMLDAAMTEAHLAPLLRQAELQAASLEDMLAGGMHHAIVCTEDVPRMSVSDIDASRDTYLGTVLVDALFASCADWPAGRLDADFFEPLSSDLPTLILSGEADPITPPAYGNRVAESLTSVRHIVNPGQAHMQSPLGCVPIVMAQFIDTADPASLAVDCLDRLVPPPFFIDANGPRP